MSDALAKKERSIAKDLRQSKVEDKLSKSFRSAKKSHKAYKKKQKDKPWVLYHRWPNSFLGEGWIEYGRYTSKALAEINLKKGIRTREGLVSYRRMSISKITDKDKRVASEEALEQYLEGLKSKWKIEYEPK